jgi:hypothetical protein
MKWPAQPVNIEPTNRLLNSRLAICRRLGYSCYQPEATHCEIASSRHRHQESYEGTQ